MIGCFCNTFKRVGVHAYGCPAGEPEDEPTTCARCAEPAITNIDGDNLCQAHADAWDKFFASDSVEIDPRNSNPLPE